MSQAVTEQNHSAGAMRAKTAAAFLGIGQSTFWRWVKEGRIPKGKRLSARATVWIRSDLEQFLAGAQ